jgi:hypothetical protein
MAGGRAGGSFAIVRPIASAGGWYHNIADCFDRRR